MPIRRDADGRPMEVPSERASSGPLDDPERRHPPGGLSPNDLPTKPYRSADSSGDARPSDIPTIPVGSPKVVAGSTSGERGNQLLAASERHTTLLRATDLRAHKRVEVSPEDLPVGWLVVVEGPGKGNIAPLGFGWNYIGRDNTRKNRVVLDFGDSAISAEDHAAINFDEQAGTFRLVHRSGKNATYANGSLVDLPVTIQHGAEIRIGATTLRFVRLCGPDFSWE